MRRPQDPRPPITLQPRIQAEPGWEPRQIRPEHRHVPPGQLINDLVNGQVEVLAQYQNRHREQLTGPSSNPPADCPYRPWSRSWFLSQPMDTAEPPTRRRSLRSAAPRNIGPAGASRPCAPPAARPPATRTAGWQHRSAG